MKWKPIAAILVLVVVSTGVALAAGEILLRLAPSLVPPDVRLRAHWSSIARAPAHSVAHPYIGFVYRANHEGRIEHQDFAFTYHTDPNGFRNAASLPPKADIVVLGDSLAFSYGVDDELAWTKRLEAALPGVALVNLGLVGASPQQYLRVYETFGRSFGPKLVLLCIFPGNDVTDERSFMEWLAAGGDGNYDVWRFFRGDAPRTEMQSYLLLSVASGLRSLRDRYGTRTLDLPRGGRLNLTPNLIERSSRQVARGNEYFEHAMQSVETTVREIREDGGRPLVVLFPTKEEVYLPLEGEPTPEPLATFADALRELEIAYVDLTPGLQEVARRGEKLYFEVDGHPNAAGYEVVTGILRSYLMDHRAELDLDAWLPRENGGQ